MANVRIAFEVLKGLTLEHMREGEVNQDLNMLEQPDFLYVNRLQVYL